MKRQLISSIVCGSLVLASPLHAQSAGDYHPWLTSRFHLAVGLFVPTSNVQLSVDGSVPGDDVDLEGKAGVDDTTSTFSLDFTWRLGEKWSLSGQYWDSDNSGTATLTEDVTWRDVTFGAGTFVGAGLDTTVARAFLGRNLSTGPQHEFGVGVGVHRMKIEAFIEGEAIVNGEQGGFRRESAEVKGPLPNIGAWYLYSPSARWLIRARLDWLSADVSDYDGTLINSAVGVDFLLTKHLGIGLAYQYFSLDVDVDAGEDWTGGADLEDHGPFLALSVSW